MYYRPDCKVCKGKTWHEDCQDCGEEYCAFTGHSCYECVTAWRCKACAYEHEEKTKHTGQVNDLVYWVKYRG